MKERKVTFLLGIYVVFIDKNGVQSYTTMALSTDNTCNDV